MTASAGSSRDGRGTRLVRAQRADPIIRALEAQVSGRSAARPPTTPTQPTPFASSAGLQSESPQVFRVSVGRGRARSRLCASVVPAGPVGTWRVDALPGWEVGSYSAASGKEASND